LETKLTPDQLCEKARQHEKENTWFQRLVILICIGLGAILGLLTVETEQLWVRRGFAWMLVLLALACLGAVRVGARRIQVGESYGHFMIREFEGGRRTLLAMRWGLVLLVPSLLMLTWGGTAAIRAHNLPIDEELHRDLLLTNLWPFVPIPLVLLAAWVFLGREAGKKADQAEQLRRAIAGQE
jgi:hypothetical protein